jgi:hypothetical protein
VWFGPGFFSVSRRDQLLGVCHGSLWVFGQIFKIIRSSVIFIVTAREQKVHVISEWMPSYSGICCGFL